VVWERDFSSPKPSRSAVRPPKPPIQWVPWAVCPGVKRREREVNHSPPSITEVKNEWRYTSANPLCFHGVGRENFTFTFVPCYSSVDEKGMQSAAGKTDEAIV
jgi:hypothetical protein